MAIISQCMSHQRKKSHYAFRIFTIYREPKTRWRERIKEKEERRKELLGIEKRLRKNKKNEA